MKNARCKERIFSGERLDIGGHMCPFQAVKDGYCLKHHPDAVKARKERLEKAYLERDKNAPWRVEMALHERIKALESVLSGIVQTLPSRRDWLDPDLEKQAKALLKKGVDDEKSHNQH
jgi:hypothetical protein